MNRRGAERVDTDGNATEVPVPGVSHLAAKRPKHALFVLELKLPAPAMVRVVGGVMVILILRPEPEFLCRSIRYELEKKVCIVSPPPSCVDPPPCSKKGVIFSVT